MPLLEYMHFYARKYDVRCVFGSAQLYYIFIAYYMQNKGEEGVQMTCKITYVLNGLTSYLYLVHAYPTCILYKCLVLTQVWINLGIQFPTA